MGDAMEERGKALEEEYFHRKNKEAIEKMREKMRVALQAKTAGTSSMQCPRCDGKLVSQTFGKVEVDVCPKCSGLWLDARELEQLAGHEGSGWLSNLWKSWNAE